MEEALWGRFYWRFNKVRGKLSLKDPKINLFGTSYWGNAQSP
jgi:hypothetical protein